MSRKNALFSGRCVEPLFGTPTASVTAIIFFLLLSQPKRGKGRGVFSSSSSALKEKQEERRREFILDCYLVFATRLTFNVGVDLSQKYLQGLQKNTLKGQCVFYIQDFITIFVDWNHIALTIVTSQCWQ